MGFLFATTWLQGDVSSDSRLSKVMDFDSSLVPMQQFIKQAATAAGVPLRVVPAVYDLKIDAYVDGQPLGVTLAKLAEACDLKWEAEDNGYKLVLDVQKNNRENAYLVEEDRLASQYVDKEIAIYKLIDQLVPRSDEPWEPPKNGKHRFSSFVAQRDKAVQDTEDAADRQLSEDERFKMDVRVGALNQIAGGHPNLGLARLIASMNEQELKAFRSGTPFLASNYPKSRFRFSKGDESLFTSFTDSDGKPLPKNIVILSRVTPASKRIGYKELSFAGRNSGLSGDASPEFPFDSLAPFLAKMAFAVDLKAWNQVDTIAEKMSAPLDANAPQAAAWDSPWSTKRWRMGDHLRWFHRATGVPIIAPANRTVHPFVLLNRPAKNQGDYLAKLLRANQGYVHQSGPFVLVRDGHYWRKRRNEIPEDVYSTLESVPDVKKLTLLDYARFCTRLTRSQAAAIQDRNGGFATKFPKINFAEAYPALVFLGKLSTAQATQALTEEGLPNQALNAEQKAQFMDSVIEGIMNNGWVSEPLLKSLIDKGFDPDSVGSMVFRIRKTKQSVVYGGYNVNDGGQDVEVMPQQNFPDRPTAVFEFGYDAKNVISFSTEDK